MKILSIGKPMDQKALLYIADERVKVVQKQFDFPFQVKIHLLYIRNLISRYTPQTNKFSHQLGDIRMFRTSLLAVAEAQKQYKCATTGEWYVVFMQWNSY